MAQALATSADRVLSQSRGAVEEALDFIWEHGDTPAFSQAEMDRRLRPIFSSVTRAIERNDRGLTEWFSDRLTALSARLLRSRQPEPSVYFAIYVRALGDITYALSADNAALESAHSEVTRRKAILPLISALHSSPNSLSASQLAQRLSMKPSNLSPVLRAAEDVGLVTCYQAGRTKQCSISRLGQAYMDVFARPLRHRVSVKLIDEYWARVMQAKDSESARAEAVQAAVDANPSFTTSAVEGLCRYATRVDREQIAVQKLRERLEDEDQWVLVFKDSDEASELLGERAVQPELHCAVVNVDRNHVEFMPEGGERDGKTVVVQYKRFLQRDVKLRKPTSRNPLPVPSVGINDLREAEEAVESCCA